MYHTIGRSIFLFLEALLTFEQVNVVLILYYVTSHTKHITILFICVLTKNILFICQGLVYKK